SLGNLSFKKSQTYTADAENRIKMGDRSKGYRIKITNSNDLSSEEISQLLSIAEIKSIEEDGVTTYYLGDYESLSLAVSRKSFLDEIGLSSDMFFYEFGKATLITDVEAEQIASALNLEVAEDKAVTFRVQIGAFRYRLSEDVFNDVPDLLIIEGNDGLTRYVSGSFKTLKNAAEHKIDLLLKGFEGAFVTAYREGKRITLKEAGATTTATEDISNSKASGNINTDFVKFTVQLGSFNGRVPADVLSSYMKLNGVRPVRGDNGTTKYVFGQFNSTSEASKALPELREKGFNDAFVVGEFNGKIIKAQEAVKIKGN
ncbi:MAG TPA: SPOR domain-containing protein, partial [Cryomorphaceae bacterium]|nr:SPOR domain-containing protein [Cryomorphaceae bacterium]